MFTFEPLTPSDIIEILGIIASLITSIIAIVVSVKTLKQNSRMLEESTRPYVVVYTGVTDFGNLSYYLIVKNFGQTGAVVTSISCDHDLSLYSCNEACVPFKHFNGTFIAPGQSFLCTIDQLEFFQNPVDLCFSIEYTANNKTYSDCFHLNPKADSDLIQERPNGKNEQDLYNISCTLQSLVERHL